MADQGGECVSLCSLCVAVCEADSSTIRGERRTRAEVGEGEVMGGEVGAACR